MFTTAIVNHKGGSGKTTLAVNLAAALAERGRKVLLLDLDPHGAASGWLGHAADGRDLLDALLDARDLLPLVRGPACGVDVVPAGPAIVNLDRFAVEQPGSETLLRTALAKLPGSWDHLLIDCPPNLHLGTVNALVAAGAALVPVAAHALSLDSLGLLVQTMIHVRDRLNQGFQLSGLVACRVDSRGNHSRKVVGLLRERFGSHVYEAEIAESVRLAESPGVGMPVTRHDPRGRSAREFHALADEFERREAERIAARSAGGSAAASWDHEAGERATAPGDPSPTTRSEEERVVIADTGP